ncbi:tRNA (guanosine(37)-N1)-methyltransferase TrmD [Candidatus Kaiserbacteria bacterium]|nr:tRNA (guanosine(37)-N1)-methyltransferase TrmD [Candidatus Kaiserbacteria bacterium]
MKFHLITLFPEACEAYLSASIIGRARRQKKIKVAYQNPRDFVANKWGKADERPYGGGPGMVMGAEPVIRATSRALRGTKNPTIIWFSPAAKQFTNKDADALAKKYSDIILVCGRYEGVDERAKAILKTLGPVKTFAVGQAVYTGGELPALAIVDAVTRRLPGVLGKDASIEERRVASHKVYTRPETILYKKKKYRVPRVLRTGHQAKITAWRKGK